MSFLIAVVNPFNKYFSSWLCMREEGEVEEGANVIVSYGVGFLVGEDRVGEDLGDGERFGKDVDVVFFVGDKNLVSMDSGR
tara:strand:+ start:203 stop:445 length:243 start_codon:yes stop_codon:yes gene_type:complete